MKIIIMFLFICLMLASSNSLANSDYCDEDIKEVIANNREVFITDEIENNINLTIEPQPSLAPTEEESDDPCWDSPGVSTAGIEDELSTIYNDAVRDMAETLEDIKNLTLDPATILQNLLNLVIDGINELCVTFIEEVTSAVESIIEIPSTSKSFDTIPYVGDSIGDAVDDSVKTYEFGSGNSSGSSVAVEVLGD